jgi:hypothetical protein
MIVEPADLVCSSSDGAVLQITKGCWVVLPKDQFVAALKRGRVWRRAAEMRSRQPDAATSDDRRRDATQGGRR